MPFKLAFMTVGILREAVGHAQVQGFVDPGRRLDGLSRISRKRKEGIPQGLKPHLLC